MLTRCLAFCCPDGRSRQELTTLADEPVSSSNNCEASCESSCAELSKEEGCSGCAGAR